MNVFSLEQLNKSCRWLVVVANHGYDCLNKLIFILNKKSKTKGNVMSKLIEQVKQAILPALNSLSAELVDIEFEKKHGADNLTVFIETADGVTLDYCERVHTAIDPVLDVLDPTNGQPYVLNVSSPGLDRPFKTGRDFERNYGKEVEIKLYAPLMGKKLFEGVLIAHDQNTTTILAAAKAGSKSCVKSDKSFKNDVEIEEIKLENNRIAFVRPLVKFS